MAFLEKTMIEYPSIQNSSKAPREKCIAFEKFDGSNIRVKYTRKNGFELFGSKQQLFDETHPFLAPCIPYFFKHYSKPLGEIFSSREFSNVKEIISFGEFFSKNTFAGIHNPKDETRKFVLFDVMVVYKQNYADFVLPQDFRKTFEDKVETPRVVYEGNLTDEFIASVRRNDFELDEGVICKGTQGKGSYRGKVWMAKIKTQAYLDRLKNRFGDEWSKYGE